MSDNHQPVINPELLDTIGRAFGYAMALHDQTARGGDRFSRINDTADQLVEQLDDERFSPDEAAILDGVIGGLTAFKRSRILQDAGRIGPDDKLI